MPLTGLIYVALGGALGAILRWLLALALNHLSANLAIGTLAANLLGATLMGFMAAALAEAITIPTQWQLFLVTGFLGGLTTFATFTDQSFTLLHQGQISYFFLHLLLHLVGSLLCFSLSWLLFKSINT